MPKRYITVAVCFISMLNAMQTRSLLSVAITRMVKPIESVSSKVDVSICLKAAENVSVSNSINASSFDSQLIEQDTRFDWSQELQGLVLSSLYYGYVIAHIPTGVLVHKYGAKIMLSLSLFFSAVFNLLTPMAVEWGGSSALIALRFLVGLSQGGLFPGVGALLSAWIPITERSFLAATAYTGTAVSQRLYSLKKHRFFVWERMSHFDDFFPDWNRLGYIFLRTFDAFLRWLACGLLRLWWCWSHWHRFTCELFPVYRAALEVQ